MSLHAFRDRIDAPQDHRPWFYSGVYIKRQAGREILTPCRWSFKWANWKATLRAVAMLWNVRNELLNVYAAARVEQFRSQALVSACDACEAALAAQVEIYEEDPE